MRKWFSAGLFALVCTTQTTVQADFLTGQITGMFDSSGTNIYSQDGVTIVFTGVGPGTVETPTFASFGTFNVTAAPVLPVGFSDHFTLTITETSPNASSVSFAGALEGQMSQSASSVFASFFTPLTKVLDAGTLFPHFVTITSSDEGIPGRVNLGPLAFPSSSISGSITPLAVPEPGSLVLLGLGIVGGAGSLMFAARSRCC
jgi:hypothetical protein